MDGDHAEAGAARTLRVAAVQMPSRLGHIESNLRRATGHAEAAAREEAELVLFHELMPGGYAWDTSAWTSAEPTSGPTVVWLRETAARLGLWMGTSFLEAAGDDFWNTFVLVGPDGIEAGRVRKEFPSMYESRVFRGDAGAHTIETPIGRIGVAICFDAHAAAVGGRLAVAGVDLVLAPHCYCVPREPSRGVSQSDIDRLVRNLTAVPTILAEALGVPVVATNRVGDWDVPKGAGYVFPGQATVVDGDGAVRAHLGEDEGVCVADVCLEPGRRTGNAPRAYGRYVYPGPPGRELLRVIEWREGRRYRGDSARVVAVHATARAAAQAPVAR